MSTVTGEIRVKWLSLGGAGSFLGEPTSDTLPGPDGVGWFTHFGGGSIFWTPATGAHVVNGEIKKRWDAMDNERSFLGYPISDVMEFVEGGWVCYFQGGAIYWWPDTGAIELNDVVVHYTGIVCFGETNEISDSDEPYVVMGLNSPTGSWAIRSQVYEDVDGGESRPDLIELYRGKPNGLAISVLLMENDEGNPDKYKEAMQAAVGAAFTGVTALVAIIPVVGAVIASVVGTLLAAVAPTVGEALNDLLDTGDDRIGDATLPITPKQMIILAARTGNSEEKGVVFKLVTPLLSSDGASYKVYFGLVPA